MAAHTRDIARFKNATLIGRGGFGSVYRASDDEHGRAVAIKVLQGSLGETERRRFDRERQTMGRLGAHPNIVPVHESGYTEQGEGYIVMELAAKGSVGDRLEREGALPWREAVSIIVAIARAAQAAHDQGVLHRDIKPDNILIDAYDNPRLTDFGIAAVASNATATTSTTATIAHAAPEVLHGLPPTPSVDIYALGSTLYNLIIGRPPFQEPGDHGVPAMITRALSQPPPDLRRFGLPGAVAEIAERALAKESGSRQASAAQLADQLQGALEAAPTGGVGPAAGAAGAPTIVAGIPAAPPPTPSVPNVGASAGVPPPVPVAGEPPTVMSGPVAAPDTAQTMINPSAEAGGPHAAYGYQAGGTAPPLGTSGATGGGNDGRPGSNRLVYLLAGVSVALVMAIGAILVLSDRGADDPSGAAQAGEGETSADTEGGDDGETTSSSATTSTASSTTASSTTASTTTTTATTSTTASTTSTTTTTTTSTTAGDPDCPVAVVDTRTNRFNVQICGDGSGRLTYVGQNRSTGEGITLPACHVGGLIFLATNEGFEYVVDVQQELLLVTDPNGDVVVNEALRAPIAIDNSAVLDGC